MTSRTLLALAAVALAGCGGNDNIVNGSYRGQSIDVSDGILLPPIQDTGGGAVSVFYLRPRMDVIRERLLKLEGGGDLPPWTKLAVHARPARDEGVGPRPIA